jgi:hypothetical protein
VGDADDLITETEGEEQLGGVRHERDDPHDRGERSERVA